jgi:hypothetical protein
MPMKRMQPKKRKSIFDYCDADTKVFVRVGGVNGELVEATFISFQLGLGLVIATDPMPQTMHND